MTLNYPVHQLQKLIDRQVSLHPVRVDDHQERIAHYVPASAIKRNQVTRLYISTVSDKLVKVYLNQLDRIQVFSGCYAVIYKPPPHIPKPIARDSRGIRHRKGL